MSRVSFLIVSVFFGVAALAAQADGIDAAKAEVLRAEAAMQAARAAAPTKPAQPALPEQPRRVETSGLRAVALRFDPSYRPRRLVPGGTGTLSVVVSLIGDNVLVRDPGATFVVEPEQGPIEVGAPVFRPVASPGGRSLAPALKQI
ncbi:MAG: hypothetical protein ABL982_21600, partial [Vicinamibacterales bacterium]